MIAETLETHKVPTIVLDPVCGFLFGQTLCVDSFTNGVNRSWCLQAGHSYCRSQP